MNLKALRNRADRRWSVAIRLLYRYPGIGYLLLLSPIAAYLAVMFAFPLLRVFWISFFNPRFTLEHFLHFFSAPVYVHVLWTTFGVAAQVTVCALVLGYPPAYLLNQAPPTVRRVLLILVLFPFWTSLLVRNYAWLVLLQRAGLINSLLVSLGVIHAPVSLVHNRLGVLVGMINVLLPFMILPLLSVMRGVSPDLLRAAHSLGARPMQAFLRVFLPLSLPGVVAGCLLVFMTALGFFITPELLGAPQDTMISQLIAIQIDQVVNWGFGGAIAIVLLTFTVILFLLCSRFLGFDRLFGGTSR
jgi:putative spermidine/putrescine transport system permease protein